MQYVYMQKPRPADVTGVEVTLTVFDSNKNTREIGKTMTDANGFFTLNWKPDIEGNYTVYASFAGSESYWPSQAVSSFTVDPAVKMPEIPQVVIPDYTMTILEATIAIIIAVVIVGALTIILRKRP